MDIPSFAMFTGVLQGLIFWGFVLFLILGLAIGPRYIRSRDRQRLYDLMKLAYEKGQPVPPELIEAIQRDGRADVRTTAERDLRRAIVLMGVALGLIGIGGATSYYGGADTFWALVAGAAIPGFIGLGFLLLWFLKRKNVAA